MFITPFLKGVAWLGSLAGVGLIAAGLGCLAASVAKTWFTLAVLFIILWACWSIWFLLLRDD